MRCLSYTVLLFQRNWVQKLSNKTETIHTQIFVAVSEVTETQSSLYLSTSALILWEHTAEIFHLLWNLDHFVRGIPYVWPTNTFLLQTEWRQNGAEPEAFKTQLALNPLILFFLPVFFKGLFVAPAYLFGLIRTFWFYLLFLNNAVAFRAFIRKHLSFPQDIYQHRTAVYLFAYFGEYGLSGDREKKV